MFLNEIFSRRRFAARFLNFALHIGILVLWFGPSTMLFNWHHWLGIGYFIGFVIVFNRMNQMPTYETSVLDRVKLILDDESIARHDRAPTHYEFLNGLRFYLDQNLDNSDDSQK